MNQRLLRALAVSVGLFALCWFVIASVEQEAWAADHDARAILKSMSDYLDGQPAISATFDSDIEVITPQIEKLQFASSGEFLLSRPDKLRAHRFGGHSDVELVFDGRTISIFSRGLNAYAQMEMEGTVDHLLEALRAGHAVALPAADFLMSRPYDSLIADVIEAKYLGLGVIDGVRCHHLAFRNFDTDWQVWIEAGDRPVPRKLVITSKTVNAAPQYTLRTRHWDTNVRPAADAFVFLPPEGAGQLAPEDLIKLDELPEGAPAK